MAGLQDLLILRQLQDQADPVRSAFQSFAEGVSTGIEEARVEQKAKKKAAEGLAKFLGAGKGVTNSSKLTDEALADKGIKKETTFDVNTGKTTTKFKKLSRQEKLQQRKLGFEVKQLEREEALRSGQTPISSKTTSGKKIPSNGKLIETEEELIDSRKAGLVAEKTDVTGFPKDFTNIAAIEPLAVAKKLAENQAELEVLMPRIKSIMQDYNDANTEILAKLPDALDTGVEGFIARQGLKIGSSKFFDEFPAVATMADNIKADATAFAKAAGEVRPTDVDIKRFLATLLDPRERSLNTNIAKARSQRRRLENQGINVEWMTPLIAVMEETRTRRSEQKVSVGGSDVTIRRIK